MSRPGRDLDGIVALKVMGWTWSGKTAWSPSGSRNDIAHGDAWLPYYSTDIAAAWEVYERVLKLNNFEVGYDTYREVWFCTNISTDFRYTFDLSDEEFNLQMNDTCVAGKGESAPHAICLAALKVVGP